MIQPGKTEVVEFSAPTPQKSGPFSRDITVKSNDRATPTVSLQGEVNVLTALRKQPEVVNFGQLKRDTPGQKQTVVITRGDAGPLRLRISNVSNPQIKAELHEVEAGQKYELNIAIDPPWPNGMLQGAVVLESGIEQAPFETVQVFASIAPRLQAVPPRLVLQVAPATDLALTVRLNWDGEPAKLLEVTTSDPAARAEIVEDNNRQNIVFHVPAGYNPQKKVGNVSIRTDDPTVPTLQIPVTVINQPATTQPGLPTTLPARVIPGRVSAQPPVTTKPTTGTR